jgi:enoyl-CoA hydratase/carnithine racemase
VYVLTLGDTENRFHPDLLSALESALDDLETAEPPAALVTTATGRFWSNGLDLDWVGANPDQLDAYAARVQTILARFLVLPMPTVAAIQGHCFAAGAMLALAHDWRVMRADRGFFCLPEVDIQIPFTTGMDALIRAKLPVAAALEAMTTGRRYGGADAESSGIVTRAVPEGDVVAAATEHATALAGKAGATLGTIKARMFASVTAALTDAGAAPGGNDPLRADQLDR